jgi:agmatine deiminase
MTNPADPTPQALGYRWPAEWEPHRATWLAWPHNEATWPGRFVEARQQYARFVAAVARFEPVELLVHGTAESVARRMLADVPNVRFGDIPTNDSWIRDHGPIFLDGPADLPPALLDFRYNAWGDKYPPYDLDNLVPQAIARQAGRRRFEVPIVLEGGSVEGNGQGLVLTTEPCLLNPNRNPGLTRTQIEAYLHDYLCAGHIVWLTGEIPGDDTDSHIDQIGRFVDGSTVVLTDLAGSDMFRENQRRLDAWSRHYGQAIRVVRLPAPTPRQVDGMWLPASYANFYIVNSAVVVPAFGDPADDAACRVLEQCFPGRDIVPLRADDLIYGLGAFHCLSQQEPLPSRLPSEQVRDHVQ